MADRSAVHDTLAQATNFLRERLPVQSPVAAIVLGSGLGGLAQRIQGATRVSYRDIPGFAEPSVEGHAGELLHGTLGGREVLALAGRFHMYEGHEAEHSAFPVRVVHALGAPTLILSNAAGGIRRTFTPGQLMIVSDHLNLMFRNPLLGGVVSGDDRFPDMSAPYDRALIRQLHDRARALGIRLEEGVYCGLLGPSYETPAEVRMLERLGADAVGMSTVHEVVVGRAMGMRCTAVSCITNPAAGTSPHPINHAEVIEVTKVAAHDFERLIEALVQSL